MMTNELGQRGEALFYVLITKSYGRARPIFRPQFLGDKWPLVDFIVELVDAGKITPYFFVQVKTTRDGYTQRNNRLKVKVNGEDMRRLASYPAPTYIIGIDEIMEVGYIVSANGEWMNSIPNMSIDFPINKINQDQLWDEVNSFWAKSKMLNRSSRFIDSAWR
jgi:hypothetical protein